MLGLIKKIGKWKWLILLILFILLNILARINIFNLNNLIYILKFYDDSIYSFSYHYLNWIIGFLLLISLTVIADSTIKILSYYIYSKNENDIKNISFLPLFLRNKIEKIDFDYKNFDEKTKNNNIQLLTNYYYSRLIFYILTFFLSILLFIIHYLLQI